MKALPMLDHVMLWVARGFATLVLIACVTMSYSTNPYISERLAWWFVSTLWFVGTWWPGIEIGRLFFGISSAFFLTCYLIAFFESPLLLTNNTLILDIIALGFASMLWTACRPPKKSNHDTNHPFSQSC